MKTVASGQYRFELPDDEELFSGALHKYIREAQGVGAPINPDSDVIEVGACFGISTVVLAGRFNRVIALEPDPRNLELLERNLTLAGVRDKVVIVPKAASDRIGRAVFRAYESENIGGGHLAEVAPDTYGGFHDIEVETVTLDHLLEELDVRRLGLVWSDAQGGEPLLLKGAQLAIGMCPRWYLELAPYIMTFQLTAYYCQIARERFDKFADFRDGVNRRTTELPRVCGHYMANGWAGVRPRHTSIRLWRGSAF